MLDLDPTLTPQSLSRMMVLQAEYLRDAGLFREAEALSARAEAYDAFASVMAALRTAPIRDVTQSDGQPTAIVRLSDYRVAGEAR